MQPKLNVILQMQYILVVPIDSSVHYITTIREHFV